MARSFNNRLLLPPEPFVERDELHSWGIVRYRLMTRAQVEAMRPQTALWFWSI